MALQADHVLRDGFLDEQRFELLAREAPRDVHVGAERRDGGALVEAAGAVDRRVELGGLGLVDGLDAGGAALGEQPAADEHQDVDAERRRRVVEGVLLGLRPVLEHRRQRLGGAFEQVLADDDQRDARGTEVLLRAGVDEAELGDVEGPREDVAGHVGDERGRRVREERHLGARDRLVGGHVHVGGVLAVRQRREVRHVRRDFLGGVGEDVDRADLLGFLDGLVGPGAGVDVVGGAAGGEQVQRDLRELEGGAALQEQHLVVVGQAQQLGHVGDGFRVDGVVRLAAVRVFHDGHAGAGEIGQLGLGLLEDFQGEGRGTGVEVVRSAHSFLLVGCFGPLCALAPEKATAFPRAR